MLRLQNQILICHFSSSPQLCTKPNGERAQGSKKGGQLLYLGHADIPILPADARQDRVPGGPEWFHEIKYDGYRLFVVREDSRVRLLTKGGYDWTKRYPRIVEAALKNRQKHFVIDGEAIVRGVDGYSDFNALHSGSRFKQTKSLKDLLASFSKEARDKASQLPPGAEKHDMLRKARRADTEAHLDEWVNSPGLQPPK